MGGREGALDILEKKGRTECVEPTGEAMSMGLRTSALNGGRQLVRAGGPVALGEAFLAQWGWVGPTSRFDVRPLLALLPGVPFRELDSCLSPAGARRSQEGEVAGEW